MMLSTRLGEWACCKKVAYPAEPVDLLYIILLSFQSEWRGQNGGLTEAAGQHEDREPPS